MYCSAEVLLHFSVFYLFNRNISSIIESVNSTIVCAFPLHQSFSNGFHLFHSSHTLLFFSYEISFFQRANIRFFSKNSSNDWFSAQIRLLFYDFLLLNQISTHSFTFGPYEGDKVHDKNNKRVEEKWTPLHKYTNRREEWALEMDLISNARLFTSRIYIWTSNYLIPISFENRC